MKKTKLIILDVCILFLLALSVLVLVMSIKDLIPSVSALASDREWYQRLMSEESPDPSVVNMVGNSIEFYESYVTKYSIYTALGFVALAACAFVFVYCNPRLFRLSSWTNLSEEWKQNKEERAMRKQDKESAAKQTRIEKLQAERDKLNAELDELNANDTDKN